MPNIEDEKEERKHRIAMLLDGINNLWIGPEFVGHLYSVFDRLPLSGLQKLGEKGPAFFAPDRNFLGRVTRFDRSLDAGELVVYLSPELLSHSPEEVQSVIAHELAHVVLGHKEESSPNAAADAAAGEREADRLAETWGFRLPKRGVEAMSHKAYAFTTATLFTLIGLLHALRLTFRWTAVLEGRLVPMWASWIGFVVALLLAFEGFRLARKG